MSDRVNIVDDDEIDLLALFKTLLKHAFAIILTAAIFGFAAFGFTKFLISPTYEATVSFYVNNSSFAIGATSFSISSSELSASNSLVDTYIFILNSRTTLEEIIADTGVDYKYDELAEMITSQPVNGTAGFNITVTSTKPMETELIANSIAKILPERIVEIVDGSSVRIVDYAIIPSHRAGPSYTKNTAIGLLAGGFLACAIVVVSSIVEDKKNAVIQNADELKSLFSNIPVIGIIPDLNYEPKKGNYYSSYYGAGRRGAK